LARYWRGHKSGMAASPPPHRLRSPRRRFPRNPRRPGSRRWRGDAPAR
jgi:hypothetical protein